MTVAPGVLPRSRPGNGLVAVKHVLDTSVVRSRDGRLLAGGAPPRLVRLTAAGACALDDALAGRPLGDDAVRLVARLERHSMLHPRGDRPRRPVPVTSVIPAHNAADSIARLVAALRTDGTVVVVDDRSSDDTATVAAAAGAVVLPNNGPPGPSATRNTGLAVADTDLVAFVDADCVATARWHDRLTALFADPQLALAAPRVPSLPGTSWLARYEQAYSPLDLGDQPALVGPGRRVSYVPSAALLARRRALLDIGGFDPSMTVGEDVDLVWRLIDAGWNVRYAPEARVLHRPRQSLAALAGQRYAYGTSAPNLERRHPGAARPLRAPPTTLAIWAASALGTPAAALALATDVLAATRASSDTASRHAIARLVARSHADAARHLARIAVREWLALTALASWRSPRIRRLTAVAFLADLTLSRREHPRTTVAPAHAVLRAVDHASYATGLWRAMWSTRSFAAISLRITRLSRFDPPARHPALRSSTTHASDTAPTRNR